MEVVREYEGISKEFDVWWDGYLNYPMSQARLKQSGLVYIVLLMTQWPKLN